MILDALTQLNQQLAESYKTLNEEYNTNITAPFIPILPHDAPMTDGNGNLTYQWREYFNQLNVSMAKSLLAMSELMIEQRNA